MTTRPLAAALVCLLLFVAPAPAAASPQGVPAAPFCGQNVEHATDRAGLNATVESSAARARIREDGRARWTTTVAFADPATATRLLVDDALRRTVVEEISGSFEATNATFAGEGANSLVVRYVTDDFAARTPGGLYRVDHFRIPGSEFRTYDCDSLTVVAPPGYAPAADPEGASVRADGNRAVVAAEGDADDFFLLFAPTDLPSPVRSALAQVALGSGVSGVVAGNLLWFVCLPGAAFAGAFVGWHRLLGALLGRDAARGVTAREAGLGVLALLLAGGVPAGLLFGLAAGSPFLPVAAGVAAGALLVGLDSRGAPPSVRGSFLPVVAGGAAAAVVAAGGVLAGVVPDSLAAACVFASTLPILGYPLGVAATGGRSARRVVAVSVVAFAAAVVSWVPMAEAGGSLYGILVLSAVAAALGVAVAAVPFALVGAAAGGR